MTFTTTELLTLLTVVAAFTTIIVTIILWQIDHRRKSKVALPKVNVTTALVKQMPNLVRVNVHFTPNDEPWMVKSMKVTSKPNLPIYDLTEMYNWDSSGQYSFQTGKVSGAIAKTIFARVGILENNSLSNSFIIGLIVDSNDADKAIKLKAKFYMSLESATLKNSKIVVKRTLNAHISNR